MKILSIALASVGLLDIADLGTAAESGTVWIRRAVDADETGVADVRVHAFGTRGALTVGVVRRANEAFSARVADADIGRVGAI